MESSDGGRMVARWQRWVVLGTQIAAMALALIATVIYGRWLPWSDDFSIVPFVTGDNPISVAWLWAQHNEHRIPLVKLLFVALGRMSGGDYRWTLATNVLLLSGTAWAMVLTARRLRGTASWTDAMFPALLLNLGQGALVWGFQVQFVLTTTLGGVFVATAVAGPRGAVRRAAMLAVTASLLPLTGSSGLVVAAGATCLLVAEALGWNTGSGRPTRPARGLAAVGAAITIAIAVAYMMALEFTNADSYAGPWQTLVAALDTLSSYPGVLVNQSRTAWRIGTAIAVIGTIAAGVRAWRHADPDRRGRLSTLLGYLAALCLVALAVGYGRGSRDFTHLYGHYATLVLGVPIGIGLVMAALPQTRIPRVAAAVVCVVALVIASTHARLATRHFGSGSEASAVVVTDIRGQLPADEVAARHAATLFFIDTPATRAMIARGITALRRSTFPLYCTRPSPAAAMPGGGGAVTDRGAGADQ